MVHFSVGTPTEEELGDAVSRGDFVFHSSV